MANEPLTPEKRDEIRQRNEERQAVWPLTGDELREERDDMGALLAEVERLT